MKQEEKEELDEFEKELQTIISDASYWTSDDGNFSTYCLFGDKEIKKISTQIFDLARKEILKDLPKWKKIQTELVKDIPVIYTNSSTNKTYVLYNGYQVCVNELFERLQKEE